MISQRKFRSSNGRSRLLKSADSHALRSTRHPGEIPAAQRIFAAHEGYDLAAPGFDQWKWSAFWKHNEAPIVERWIATLHAGPGMDAGCGTGVYTKSLRSAGLLCTEVDISRPMLRILRRKHVGSGAPPDVAQVDLRMLPFADAAFDWILCTRALSNIGRPGAVFSEFARVLRPGGRALITDVHPEHPYTCTSIPSEIGCISIQTYKHGISTIVHEMESTGAFAIRDLHEYRASELPWLPAGTPFRKLQSSEDTPVFYSVELDRNRA